MNKVPGWPEVLAEYIESRRHSPFEWGENDCVMFLVGAIEAMTGENISKGYPGYKTEKAAARIIKKNGGLIGLARKVGLKEKPPKLAQRGDGVLADIDGRETCGVVIGNGTFAAPGIGELVFRPMSEAVVALES